MPRVRSRFWIIYYLAQSIIIFLSGLFGYWLYPVIHNPEPEITRLQIEFLLDDIPLTNDSLNMFIDKILEYQEAKKQVINGER